jgi:hypothetical protein
VSALGVGGGPGGDNYFPDVMQGEQHMNTVRRCSLLVALLLALVGCGGTPPDTEPVPLYPGADPISSSENFAAGLLHAMAQEMVAETEFQATPQFYILPGGATFADVAGFYHGELTERGWTPYEEVPPLDQGGIAGWQHGSSQVFIIRVMPDEINGTTVLMTMEAQRQE